eukprot:gene8241-16945_t
MEGNIIITGGALLISSIFIFQRLIRLRKHSKSPAQCIILITGCDSGFGALTALELTKLGYKVIATSLTKEGCDRLSGKVALSIICDVTRAIDIKTLAETTSESAANWGCDVWAVINNAGIGIMGNIDWQSLEAFQLTMNVNYFGLVAVTKAFLPLLKCVPHSRVINLSSMAGFMTTPAMGSYSASKHAVEGFSKTLSIELQPWDIHVCNINPAFMRTPMVENARKGGDDPRYVDAAVLAQYNPSAFDSLETLMKNTAEDPELVVKAVVRAVEAQVPPGHIFVGWAANTLRMLDMLVPEWVKFRLNCASRTTFRPIAATLTALRNKH